ncbi:MAG: M20/M25/M40 family metallo-hydrolase [Clostridia bacterium]|nr:M20/M25/M40 family metallo-hydrolase [Clostridia bacterium]
MEKLFEKIDELSDKYLDVLENVCNIESPTDYKEGVDKACRYITDIAEKRGWKVEILKQPVSGDAVCITMNGDVDARPFAISGHMDTVHPVGSFGSPATTRDAEKMYGPGTSDCKGGVIAGLLAMVALEETGFRKNPVKLILQTDEETSSKGSNKETVRFMCEKAKDAIAFFNMEGMLTEKATIQRKGIVRHKFKVKGIATHSAGCAEGGANAILEASHKIIALEKFKDNDGTTCSCNIISGGTKANTVPEYCEIVTDTRFATSKALEEFRKTAQEIADKTFVDGCICQLEEISVRPPMERKAANEELLEKMNEIYIKYKLPAIEGGFSKGGSDAAYTTEADIPSIDSIGVDGGRIHSTEEFMYLKSLAEAAKRVASVIKEM